MERLQRSGSRSTALLLQRDKAAVVAVSLSCARRQPITLPLVTASLTAVTALFVPLFPTGLPERSAYRGQLDHTPRGVLEEAPTPQASPLLARQARVLAERR
jgi:hypothetical protein